MSGPAPLLRLIGQAGGPATATTGRVLTTTVASPAGRTRFAVFSIGVAALLSGTSFTDPLAGSTWTADRFINTAPSVAFGRNSSPVAIPAGTVITVTHGSVSGAWNWAIFDADLDALIAQPPGTTVTTTLTSPALSGLRPNSVMVWLSAHNQPATAFTITGWTPAGIQTQWVGTPQNHAIVAAAGPAGAQAASVTMTVTPAGGTGTNRVAIYAFEGRNAPLKVWDGSDWLDISAAGARAFDGTDWLSLR